MKYAIYSCLSFLVSGLASGATLSLQWPEHWETREPVQRGAALFLEGREVREGRAAQNLKITAVNVSTAAKPVTPASIKELAEKLRDAAAGTAVEKPVALQPLKQQQGYYFVVTDKNYSAKPDDYRQMVEGVLLSAGYLINFTLLTNDASSSGTVKLLAALEDLRIE